LVLPMKKKLITPSLSFYPPNNFGHPSAFKSTLPVVQPR